jgi:hypothetical protein
LGHYESPNGRALTTFAHRVHYRANNLHPALNEMAALRSNPA